MQLLYSSTSLAFTQLLRLTLDREGIEFYCSDADSSVAGIAGPMGGSQSRFYVLHEHDWERAVELLRELLPKPKRSPKVDSATSRRLPAWQVASGVALVLALVGAALAR